ncbi:MAG: molybdopterin-binding protein [Lachnospiraceae bacterium]|nr:molybdopterin-binding protein [Lachnospiraceae bacterium]
MEKVRVEDAVGMPLGHDLTAMYPGFKGALFKRGHVIEEKDIELLLDIGKKTIYVGDLNKDELHEEDCARRLAGMAELEGAHYEGPSEGKVLLIADIKGMFRVNTKLLRLINEIGDITVSTLPDHYRVEEGARLASMRIVPLFTKEEQILKAESLCENDRLFELLPYKELNAGIIVTGSEIYNGRIKDRFEAVVRRKLAYYPGRIVNVKICDDDMDMIIDAAGDLMEKGADFLIFTGGMSVDPDDLTPGAIKKLGADIISYGVPSQPGNMTLVAYLKDIPILGVPGAAISLPTTMFDVLLPQIYSGLKISKRDLINLGDGGLCQMCKECHFPNCSFGRY